MILIPSASGVALALLFLACCFIYGKISRFTDKIFSYEYKKPDIKPYCKEEEFKQVKSNYIKSVFDKKIVRHT